MVMKDRATEGFSFPHRSLARFHFMSGFILILPLPCRPSKVTLRKLSFEI